ncbi:glycosyltransferase family 4 protein [Flavobacterium rakeshii]|uniref:glycosyltransferase family 4 protein n=1 Tax=Flavobacterium rakeshii TaxID=1038845 RepID=UPI002E7BE3C0|nr:glycosyltransferase family 4 protein [Flavobacterium rakeshii]MEE1896851.1 glycosyltransferase family 4 protein [Flavobacterium rakeshii]
MKNKLVRITTVPISLEKLLENQLRYMNDFYEVIAISSDAERLNRFGENQGVRAYTVEMTRTISPLKDVFALIKMMKVLKKEKPFIVHTHTPKAGIVGMLAAKIVGIPHRLHTVAGLPLLETNGMKRKVLNFVEKLTYNCATKVYPNSYGLNEVIVREGFCESSKLKVLANGSSNGINTAYFNSNFWSDNDKLVFKESLGVLESDFVFVFVGRLVRDKGINELVHVFDKLSSGIKNIKMLLVGPYESELDPLLPETVGIIKKNKLIIETGFQKDVRPYLDISNVLVFPSYREGFPNVVMQAGAMGLPSIVTNINGCNEIIINDVNGFIISVKNTKQLHDAMFRVYEDTQVYESMRDKSREMIVSRYEQLIVWEAIHEEYKSFENDL